LLQFDLGLVNTVLLGGLFQSFFNGVGSDPVLFVGIVGGDSLFSDGDKVDRASVAPPQLSGDTPILDVFDPLEPIRFVHVGDDFEFLVSDDFEHLFLDGSAVNVPLGSEEGFNDVSGSVAETESHGVGEFSSEQALGFQILDDLVSDVESLHALVRTTVFVDGTIVIEDIHKLEVGLGSALEIVVIVSGSDLDGTSTEFGIDQFIISDDLHDSTGNERMFKFLSNEVLVSRILGVDGNGGITQHGFNTGGGDDNFLISSLDLVGELDEDTEFVFAIVAGDRQESGLVQIFIFNFYVRKGSLELAAPVDQSVRSVDKALFKESDEGFRDTLAELVIHGEDHSVPIDGGTELFELIMDTITVLMLPFPDLFQELFSSQIVLIDTFLIQHSFDDGLSTNTGMIKTRKPAGNITSHSMPSDQSIFDSSSQSVTNVEVTSNVGRGKADSESLFMRNLKSLLGISVEVFVLLPPLVPVFFDGMRVVILSHKRNILLLLQSSLQIKFRFILVFNNRSLKGSSLGSSLGSLSLRRLRHLV